MKRTAIFLGCIALLTFMIGCDETTLSNLSPEVQAMISSYTGGKMTLSARPINPGLGTQDQLRDRDRDRDQLHDGTCDNDGNQFNYGGSNGNSGNGTGSNGNGTGNGDQDRDRNRDGSCGD